MSTVETRPIQAVYIHIPFCHTICPFCAFAVHGNAPGLHGPYLEALSGEIALSSAQWGGRAEPLAAVYFGGGTPSTLSLEEVGRLLDSLRHHFPFAPDAEIAFEINPEDAAPAYLAGLRALGVNRLSLGLQSLDAATLAALHRNHDPAQGLAAARALAAHGPPNYNLDLMCGAPLKGEGAFREDVRRVAALRPPHLSLYGLDLEPGTLFHRSGAVQDWMENFLERQAAQLLWGVEFLAQQGYRHYEVSNFALPGHEGRQNLIVWEGGNYLGFGTGAHSHLDGVRRHNHRHLRAYTRALAGGTAPVAYQETLTLAQRANEGLMLALRQAQGLNVPNWEEKFGYAWEAHRRAFSDRLASEGQARWDGEILALTARGMLVADAITAGLMVD